MPRVRFQRSHGILGHSKKIMLPFIWFDSPSLRDGVKKILAQPNGEYRFERCCLKKGYR